MPLVPLRLLPPFVRIATRTGLTFYPAIGSCAIGPKETAGCLHVDLDPEPGFRCPYRRDGFTVRHDGGSPVSLATEHMGAPVGQRNAGSLGVSNGAV
jgi:hypothetical protein